MVVVSNDQCQDSCTREISESETDVPQNQVMGSISPNGILTKGRVGGESSKPRIHTDVDSFSNPTLYSLPTEVLETVLEQIHGHLPTLGALGRTCKRFYSLSVSRVHKRVMVLDWAPFWDDAVLLCLERYLTVAQKKELMDEFPRYKRLDQGDMFTLNETSALDLAAFVREIIIDTDGLPGRMDRARPLVESCLSKALANMKNLESLETKVMAAPIGRSLQALTKLTRLRIMSQSPDFTDTKPLMNIKHLNHFCFENWGEDISDRQSVDSIQSIIENSSTTLESLDLRNIDTPLECFIPRRSPLGVPIYRLDNLKSLSLHGIHFDQAFVNSLAKVIDLASLRILQLAPSPSTDDELSNDESTDDEGILYRHMTELNTSTTNKHTRLQKLSIYIPSDETWLRDKFETICDFISSFDTLQALEINYLDLMVYSSDGVDEVWESLIPAIARHKTLKTLKLWFEMQTELVKPISAVHIAALVQQLPQLRTIVLIPDESDLDKTAEAFTHSSSLESILLSPTFAKLGPVGILKRRSQLANAIIQHYLSRSRVSSGDFVWERHSKLRRIRINYTTWTISSHQGSLSRNHGGPIKITSSDGSRHVFHREKRDQGGRTSQGIECDDHLQWVGERSEISSPFYRLLF